MSESKLTLALYRGHTHGELAFLETSSIAKIIGNWCRDKLSDKEFIPKGWRWDPIRQIRVFQSFPTWKITRMFCNYDRKLQHLFVPIGFCDSLKREVESWGAEVNELRLADYPLRKIDAKMNPKFSDRPWQVELIKKCSEPDMGMKGLCMQTGRGKTYSATKSAINLGYATLVIAPNSLPNQWIDSIREQTLLKKEDIYKIEGFDSLALLSKNPTYKPAFFVCSTRTMQLFANGDDNYTLLPWTYAEFFKTYGIGVKIVDEAHLNFHANTMMDLLSNVPYNFYCSATFDQSKSRVRDIFNVVFPREIRYGMEKYDKYVSVHLFSYSGEVDEKRCVKAKGYSHMLYESELLKGVQKFNSHVEATILPVVNQLYINKRQPGQKGIIFCSTVDFIRALVKKLRAVYPDLKINEYVGESSYQVLKETDLIVTTTGKAGTGLDIKGLIFAYNLVSLKGPVLNQQLLGRLRKINNVDLAYADRYDVNLLSQLRHVEVRRPLLRSMAAKFYEYDTVYNVISSYVAPEEKKEDTNG